MKVDVTDQMYFDFNDDEYLPITQCVCGAEFKPWSFIISIYEDTPKPCPKCGRKLFWESHIRVYEVKDESNS